MRVVVLAALALMLMAGFSPADARNYCPYPRVVTQKVEVCVGSKLPRTNVELIAAVEACKGDEACKDAAITKRDKGRDLVRDVQLRQKVEKQFAQEIGRQIFPVLTGMLNVVKRDKRFGPTPLADPDALDGAIYDIKSAGEKYEKAIGPVIPQ